MTGPVAGPWHNEAVTDTKSDHSGPYIDNGWPQDLEEGEMPVTELTATHAGALSPFGDADLPMPPTEVPYIQPQTKINR